VRAFERIGLAFRHAKDPASRKAARRRAARWAMAQQRDPDLAVDVIHMGRVLALAPVDTVGRLAANDIQLAYEQGRRDLAIDLLAMMSINQAEFLQMMESDDVD